MSVKALADYTQYSKYARHNSDKKRRETWHEQVDRVAQMHKEKLGDKFELIKDDFDFAIELVKKKRILGSQRALQFGGSPILEKNAKIYNCTVSYVDRVDFFKECMYLLLCGCGVGFSVQTHHVAKLPKIVKRDKGTEVFVIPDTIEGWSDAIGVLMQSYFDDDRDFQQYDYDLVHRSFSGKKIEFDFSLIRPQGSPISWGGIAPGPDGLKNAMENIEKVFEEALERGQNRLRPIDAYDIIMHSSDAVLSGGIRRSATICLFSPDDDEMATAKTGDWFIKNPQRGRSNNSALLIRDETTREQFAKLMDSVKQFGEPGFVWADSKEALYNPCVEIGMYAYDEDGVSGFEFCNLCEINGRKANSEEEFLEMCRGAAILGTIQATYDEFDYLSPSSSKIVKREALLGVSMTGMMDNPEVLFNPEIQRKGARLILKVNEEIAEKIGINKCARATCVKPAGTTSCILGSSSGIHPHHAKRYFRRVQANKLEFPVQHFAKQNPLAVEESVWSNNKTDQVITFLCEVPDGAKTKNQIGGIDLLEHVKTTQQNWIEAGTRKDQPVATWLRHNVSNTINVKPDEWDDVEAYIYRNRKWFAGISLIPAAGDKDYPQAPFCTVYTPLEMVKHYGDGAMMASGLIVDGLKAFNKNLWAACDTVLGIGENPRADLLGVVVDANKQKELFASAQESLEEALDDNYDGPWNDFTSPEEDDPEATNIIIKYYLEHVLSMDTLMKLSQPKEPLLPHKNGYNEKQWANKLAKYASQLSAYHDNKENYQKTLSKIDWIRRVEQFADRYCDGDVRKCTYLLKDTHNWKLWLDLKREYKDVDWSAVEEESYSIDVGGIGGEACSGGKCELGDLGKQIEESKKKKSVS